MNRRDFFKNSGALVLPILGSSPAQNVEDRSGLNNNSEHNVVFVATNDNPALATRQLIESLGGIQSLFDKDDIIVLKPNSQWWLQGMTNTDVMHEFISLILAIPKFTGEIIIADNHQASAPDSRGWNTQFRNGKYNLNELVLSFNERGFKNVTKYHWSPSGPNPSPLQMDGYGNSIRKSAFEGDGYVWDESLFFECPFQNRCILAYPVFTSSYSKLVVDFKNGIVENGRYTDKNFKFINFSALNHHGPYGGATASTKNMMGVVDMSCGWPAPLPTGTFNTHHIGASKLFQTLSSKLVLDKRKRIPLFNSLYYSPAVFRFHFTGGVLGKYMRVIRQPDLNIITAIRVGWASRTNPAKSSFVNTVIASKNTVTLDYWATRNILYPLSRQNGAASQICSLNNPDQKHGPLHRFLREAQKELGGSLDKSEISVNQSGSFSVKKFSD